MFSNPLDLLTLEGNLVHNWLSQGILMMWWLSSGHEEDGYNIVFFHIIDMNYIINRMRVDNEYYKPKQPLAQLSSSLLSTMPFMIFATQEWRSCKLKHWGKGRRVGATTSKKIQLKFAFFILLNITNCGEEPQWCGNCWMAMKKLSIP